MKFLKMVRLTNTMAKLTNTMAKLTEAGGPGGAQARLTIDTRSRLRDVELILAALWRATKYPALVAEVLCSYLAIAIAGCSPASLTFNRSKRDKYGHSAFVDRDPSDRSAAPPHRYCFGFRSKTP